MVIFLVVILILGAALEIYAISDGLKHVSFDYKPSVNQTEPGQEFDIISTVTNTGRVPISYIRADVRYPISAELPEGTEQEEERFNRVSSSVYRLWGRQKVRRTMPVSIEKRGVHIFEGADLLRGDFLGLTEAKENYECRREVLVYPKLSDSNELRDALGRYCGDLVAQRWLIRDPIITLGVREYTGREPMKTISWTQSARRGELMVREFDYTRELSCGVLLCTNGLGPMEAGLLDKCCSIARTVCENLVERGVNVDFHTNAPLWGYNNRGVWSCTAGPNHMSDMREVLARVYAASRCSAAELVGTVTRASGSGTAFVMVAPRENGQISEAVSALRDISGSDVLLLYAEELDG